jgi:hypothetical protein
MAPRPQRRAKATDATKRCDNDPLVVSVLAPSWSCSFASAVGTQLSAQLVVLPRHGVLTRYTAGTHVDILFTLSLRPHLPRCFRT